MHTADYTQLANRPLAELIKLPFWQLVSLMEACDRPRRLLILQALDATR